MGNGAQPELHRAPIGSFATVHDVSFWIDMSTNNIPAFIEEPYMPPASVLKWRVYFYYQSSVKMDDLRQRIRNPSVLFDQTLHIVAPSDTGEEKVRKVYAYVAGLENQDYIPEPTLQEEEITGPKSQ